MISIVTCIENPFQRSRSMADVYATWADVSQAERLLGWRAQVAYDEGIARLVSWYQENRAWAKKAATL